MEHGFRMFKVTTTANQQATSYAGLLAGHHSTDGHKKIFLHRIVTGDEKWCPCNNMKQCNQWLRPDNQATLRVKKIIIRVKRCYAYGGTREGLSITNCLIEAKRSSRISVFYRWNDSRWLFKRKDLIGSMEFFCTFVSTHFYLLS